MRVVLAGKDSNLYDSMLDGVMSEETWLAFSKGCDGHVYGDLMVV